MTTKMILTIAAVAAGMSGGLALAEQQSVVRIDMPNGQPVFAARPVETPATIGVYAQERGIRRSVEGRREGSDRLLNAPSARASANVRTSPR
jgi:hypothetical protein